MAIFAATDYDVIINSVNLSDHLDSVDLDDEFVELVRTNFDSSGNTELIAGLRSGAITLNFHQDFAASEVHATIWPLLGTITTINVKPTSGPISATNPSFDADYLLSKWKPVAGKVGDLAVVQVTWPRTGAIVADTSA